MFHTHQCAEKALKAFIVSIQQAIPKTHDLGFLLARCAEIDPGFMLLIDESKYLDSYGYNSRYPNDHFYVDKQCTQEAVEKAEKILVTIKRKIPK